MKFTLHSATIKTLSMGDISNFILKFTLQKQEITQRVGNIRFLDIFCVLTVHYSNRQI